MKPHWTETLFDWAIGFGAALAAVCLLLAVLAAIL